MRTETDHPDPSSTGVGTAVNENVRELDQDIALLRGYLARENVEGARAFVKELEQRWPDSERVRHYAHVLAPPIARVVPDSRPRSLRTEHAWLAEHAHEYPGCWIAVLGEMLVAADPKLTVVLDAVAATPGAENGLLHREPKETGWV